MLCSLKIENVAVIEKAEVEFGPGLNVLTGETGAGKSILIDSIHAILGDRTSRDIVRSHTPKACIWPAPSWLYDCQKGNINGFLTYETKSWIEDLGIKENYCIKNGDVTIR